MWILNPRDGCGNIAVRGFNRGLLSCFVPISLGFDCFLCFLKCKQKMCDPQKVITGFFSQVSTEGESGCLVEVSRFSFSSNLYKKVKNMNLIIFSIRPKQSLLHLLFSLFTVKIVKNVCGNTDSCVCLSYIYIDI